MQRQVPAAALRRPASRLLEPQPARGHHVLPDEGGEAGQLLLHPQRQLQDALPGGPGLLPVAVLPGPAEQDTGETAHEVVQNPRRILLQVLPTCCLVVLVFLQNNKN